MSKRIMEEDLAQLEKTRTKFSSVLKRHAELTARLSRDSDKMIFERLQQEFEAARSSQTQEICVDGEEWNDGLVATIRERVHVETDRKMKENLSSCHFHEKITHRIGNKMIFCLDGARIGIRYEISVSGEVREIYHCVLESKSFLEKMTVLEHTLPFFLPLRAAENSLLSSNATKFIDHVGELVQAYVERREQVARIKDLYGTQIKDLYHSLTFNVIEFIIDHEDFKISASLRYAHLLSVLPALARVFAWPINDAGKGGPLPLHLAYAEEALLNLPLPQAYAEIVLNVGEENEDSPVHSSEGIAPSYPNNS